MISKFKRALIIAPHFDDVELGCGGAIQRLVWHDCDIHCVIVAKDDVRKKEFEKAAEILGITSFEYLDFPDTFLDTKRQEILNKFRDIKNRICPDIVFCPSEKDLHQDHATVGKEAMREFRDTTLLAYDNPWKFFDFKPDVFVRMNALTLERKIEAVQCYESQKGKKFCDKEAIKSWAITRGALVRLEYAEAFELKHMIL